MTILGILNELAATASKKEKEAILRREQDNELLKNVFLWAYDQTVNYYIKKIPTYTSNNKNFKSGLTIAMGDLLTISQRHVTGNAAIDLISSTLSNLTADDAEVVERIISRDLKCGTSDATANKIWPGLIPEFPYMRCSLPKAAKLDKWGWKTGVYSQVKADGMFANIDMIDKETTFISSRSGSQFNPEKFKNIIDEIRSRCTNIAIRLNGEFLVKRDGKVLPREIGNGILNSVLKGGDFGQNECPVYLAWDIIPLEHAVPGGKFDIPYNSRFEILTEFLNDGEVVSVIQTKIVHSIDDAYQHYFELVEQGFEGTIIKNPTAVWFDGTSKDQVKLKVEVDVDLEIVGFNEGNGKNAATFGSIACRSSCGDLEVNVSGFTDDMRKELHAIRDQLIGKIMTVKFNNIMPPAGSGKYSLFLPRFVEIREDKTIADSLQRIIEQFEAVIKRS